jgi:sensor c-di-GMP phosphodiesterase-like protein
MQASIRDRILSVAFGFAVFLTCLLVMKVAHHLDMRSQLRSTVEAVHQRSELITSQADRVFELLDKRRFDTCDPAMLGEIRKLLYSYNNVHEILLFRNGRAAPFCSATLGPLDEALPFPRYSFQSRFDPNRYYWLGFAFPPLPGTTVDFFVRSYDIGIVLDQRILSGGDAEFAWEAFSRPPGREFGEHLFGETGLYLQAQESLHHPLAFRTFAEGCSEGIWRFCVVTRDDLFAELSRNRLTVTASMLAYLAFGFLGYRWRLRRFEKRSTLAGRVRSAIRRNFRDFHCAYQPVIDMRTGEIVGCEVLARFRDQHGALPPSAFIPEIERIGWTWSFTDAILCKAIDDLAPMEDRLQGFHLSANFFQLDLHARSIPRLEASAALRILGGKPYILICEILETGLETDIDMSEAIAHLRARGFEIAIDDFGTGVANLSSVRKLSPHYIKIDRQFVGEVDASEDSLRASLVPNILAIARQVGSICIAEGVETAEQAASLDSIGIRYAQGYHFARPMPAAEFADFMKAQTPQSLQCRAVG